jgi:hypothetical protein
MPEDQGGNRADGGASEHVAGVVRSHRYPANRNQRRKHEREHSRLAVPEQYRHGYRKRCGGVIAWERRIMRRRNEEVRVPRMRHVWARARPNVHDQLRDPEREQGAESCCHNAVPAVHRAPLAAREEENREQRQEEELGVQREEAERVFEAVVAIGQLVEPVVGREIDVKTLTPNRALRGPSGRMDGSRARRERLRRGTARGVGSTMSPMPGLSGCSRTRLAPSNGKPRRSGASSPTASSSA